ncbi:MAG TPA: hypothetical protein VFG48_05955, partial [Xanthomonadales bacterium]|nr:hypothetical protein [Xanthomonadales bacterium]
MKTLLYVLVPMLMAAQAAAAQTTVAEPGRTFIKAGRLLDTASGRVLDDAVITIAGGRIEAVGDSRSAIPPDARVIDLSDATVLPGLMDMHTHLVGNVDTQYFNHYFQSPH